MFSSAKTVASVGWKVFKIVAILAVLWFLLSALNSKFGIFKGIAFIFKGVASGISKLFSFIGVTAIK